MLWEADAAYTLRRLWLVCPRVGGLTRESVAVYWTVEIPHPTVSRGPARSGREAPEVSTGAPDDLAIRRRQAVEASHEVPV